MPELAFRPRFAPARWANPAAQSGRVAQDRRTRSPASINCLIFIKVYRRAALHHIFAEMGNTAHAMRRGQLTACP
jgi:hypothetical protein